MGIAFGDRCTKRDKAYEDVDPDRIPLEPSTDTVGHN